MTVLVQKWSLGIMTLALLALAVVAIGGESVAASRYKEAQYTVLQTINKSIEIRGVYAPQLVAEVTVAGARNEAANKGFRQLFAYITGANTTQQSVAMTTPVVERPSGIHCHDHSRGGNPSQPGLGHSVLFAHPLHAKNHTKNPRMPILLFLVTQPKPWPLFALVA
ncbi:MAG: heme-binding protein [Vampirovibrionales bacterium]